MAEENNEKKGAAFFVPATGLALSSIACAILLLAALGNRFGIWNFRTSFEILRIGVYAGLAAVLISMGGGVLAVKKRAFRGIAAAVIGIIISGAVVAIPVSFKIKASRVPPIHDITTDIVNPPQFVAILPLRKDSTNPPEYGGAEIAIIQRAAYPDIQPLLLTAPWGQAFEQSLATARAMGWRIVAEVPGEGRIEATDTTFWFGFKDDIIIRVTAVDNNRSLIDVRSVSRVGRSDVGVNADRIRTFLLRLKK